MKKALLLMAAGSFMLAANAQELRKSSMVFLNAGSKEQVAHTAPKSGNLPAPVGSMQRSANRTTSGGGRWYSYADWLGATLGTGNYGLATLNLWNDTTAEVVFTTGTEYNEWTTVASSFDPYCAGFNDVTMYAGEIFISGSDAYVIDSVGLLGVYASAGAGATDHIKVGMLYGDGTSASNLPGGYWDDGGSTSSFPYAPYGTDTLFTFQLAHDSTNNTVGNTSGAPVPVVTMLPLNPVAGASCDTSSNFYRHFSVSALSVPAGNYAAAGISFISGSAPSPLNAVMDNGDGTVNYGEFYPALLYNFTGGTAAQWPTYSKTDFNHGFFKREGASDAGWGGEYIPEWAWNSGGGASELQFPVIDFHVTCATCLVLGVTDVNNNSFSGVKAYPNPANNVVNVQYHMAQNANVTITLTNMAGQVVASGSSNNTMEGTAKFNTSILPDGIYFYTLKSSAGTSTSGRISVAH